MIKRSIFWLFFLALAACGGGGGGTSTVAGSTGGGAGSGGGSTGGGGIGGGVGVGTTDSFALDVAVGGSGGLVATIRGFGSVIVNDLELDTSDTEYFIEGGSGLESDLREGQLVIIAGDLEQEIAEEIYYRSNVRGPVSAPPVVVDVLLGEGELQVLGQAVRLTAETRYENTGLELIAEGDLLEISGSVDADGVIFATYVAGLPPLGEYKVIGRIESLSGQTFRIGALSVDASGASLDDIPDDMLADDQLVEVRTPAAAFDAAALSAAASEVEGLPQPELLEGAEVEVDGYIDRFASATDFEVSGIAVTTGAQTVYENGEESLLGLNVEVEIKGIANSDGVLVADEVKFEDNASVRYEGTVSAVDAAAGTLTTPLGVVFQTGSYTEIEDEISGTEPFALEDLVAGDYVEVLAFVDSGVLVAVEVEREVPDTRTSLRGRLRAFDEAAGSVDIVGVTVLEEAGATEYEDLSGGSVDRSTFYSGLAVGVSLETRWDDFTSLSLPADRLSVEDD